MTETSTCPTPQTRAAAAPHATTPPRAFVDCVQLIRSEYLEIPGLSLTKPQAQRLWDLDPSLCDSLLGVLIATHFLRRTVSGTYVRADNGVW